MIGPDANNSVTEAIVQVSKLHSAVGEHRVCSVVGQGFESRLCSFVNQISDSWVPGRQTYQSKQYKNIMKPKNYRESNHIQPVLGVCFANNSVTEAIVQASKLARLLQ